MYSKPGWNEPFSVARAMSTSVNFQIQQKLAFLNASEISASISLLGKYMAYHLLSKGLLLTKEHLQLGLGLKHSMFECIFRYRYRSIASEILASVGMPKTTHVECIEKVKDVMHEAIVNYLGARDCITQTHLASVRRHSDFFVRQPMQRLCAGCFFACWDDVLPCGHGFCSQCTHNYYSSWRHKARFRIERCLVCHSKFAKPFGISLHPPTAGGRILSLDGGGVRGIIELEILEQIQKIIGGAIPVKELFDLIIGTSIGMCTLDFL
jgi:hypothetical protein